jgi:hypothetical protein
MSEQEEWRPVVGFPEYCVSSLGRVVSYFRPTKPRLLKSTRPEKGYPQVVVRNSERRVTRNVHQLVAEAFLGPAADGQVVRHLDGNPLNNELSNLCWGSYSENLFDSVRHGTHAMARKTHCPQGHPYDEANTYWYRRMRYCIACKRARNSASVRAA